ncbi:MAG: MaoC family dehydratase [Alphaproteobacteria bacterium]|nr:MAG: MaoC family dehydratase [Alphaproteobacteria bacterium]TMJ41059.1 MAG: MaoC family dehydratase [Alphaproteobacteria bacterium]
MSDLLHFEDFSVGESRDLGTYAVTAEEIKSFAREFDPQFFHLDDDRAKASVLGGLSASGWHTCGIVMRLMVDGYLGRTAGMGSPGLDEVRWLKPVYAGETLLGRMTVLAKRKSKSRPEMGLVTMKWEARSATGETKIDMTGVNLIKVRQP